MMKLYRYESANREDGIKICLQEYYVASETPKGYWISTAFHFSDVPEDTDIRRDRWVRKEGVNIFARTTRQAALHDFRCRKTRYKQIMEARLLELATIFDLLDA